MLNVDFKGRMLLPTRIVGAIRSRKTEVVVLNAHNTFPEIWFDFTHTHTHTQINKNKFKNAETPDRKRGDACAKEGTLSTRERSQFSFSSDQQSDNTQNIFATGVRRYESVSRRHIG